MKIKYIGKRNVYVELGGYTGPARTGDVFEIADGTRYDTKKFELADGESPAKKKNKKTDCCTVE
ncbi:hypothetical protein NO1_1688 [Candidatus Termititenax aidoneus]|uniref:Uncharacterized protein n=1 Tax=Termititenax aidoneus TaxID=2218524 RepID=A0A388TCE0_TERA1|nr:hypothetical protein NO1_1688 [Candidatus Termititenax aidoneus]